ncbi:MAG TPA: hypothetical protein VHC18_00030 [Amycolatopsis sp.]|nr:hypothetical protein [Amycolatopsis sp.]
MALVARPVKPAGLGLLALVPLGFLVVFFAWPVVAIARRRRETPLKIRLLLDEPLSGLDAELREQLAFDVADALRVAADGVRGGVVSKVHWIPRGIALISRPGS